MFRHFDQRRPRRNRRPAKSRPRRAFRRVSSPPRARADSMASRIEAKAWPSISGPTRVSGASGLPTETPPYAALSRVRKSCVQAVVDEQPAQSSCSAGPRFPSLQKPRRAGQGRDRPKGQRSPRCCRRVRAARARNVEPVSARSRAPSPSIRGGHQRNFRMLGDKLAQTATADQQAREACGAGPP